jgi:hypothetical protein
MGSMNVQMKGYSGGNCALTSEMRDAATLFGWDNVEIATPTLADEDYARYTLGFSICTSFLYEESRL